MLALLSSRRSEALQPAFLDILVHVTSPIAFVDSLRRHAYRQPRGNARQAVDGAEGEQQRPSKEDGRQQPGEHGHHSTDEECRKDNRAV